MRLWEAPRGGCATRCCTSSAFIFETSPLHLPSPPTSVLLPRLRYWKYKIAISWGKRIEIELMMEMEGSHVACGIVLSVANTKHSPTLHIKFTLRVLHAERTETTICSKLSRSLTTWNYPYSILSSLILPIHNACMYFGIVFFTNGYFFPWIVVCIVLCLGHAVAWWLRYYVTSQKVTGSNPDEVNF
jgi:hypothetical protein